MRLVREGGCAGCGRLGESPPEVTTPRAAAWVWSLDVDSSGRVTTPRSGRRRPPDRRSEPNGRPNRPCTRRIGLLESQSLRLRFRNECTSTASRSSPRRRSRPPTSLAADRRNTETAPEHLLAALLEQAEGIVLPILRKLGAQPEAIRADVNAALDAPADDHRRGRPSPRPRASCSASCAPPSARPASSATSTSPPSTSCSRWPTTGSKAGEALRRNGAAQRRRAQGARRRCAARTASPTRSPEDKYQALEKFGRDLTAAPPRTASSTR